MEKKIRKLVIYGVSSYTNSLISLCNKIDDIEIVAVCVDSEYINCVNPKCHGYDVITFELAKVLFKEAYFCVSIGYKNMRNRKLIYQKIIENGLKTTNIISPRSYVDTNNIGSGCVIFDGVVVENDVTINDNVTLWSNVTICHDVKISSHCFISANSTIGGFSSIGQLSFLGFNATVLDNIDIGQECLIGASSLVNKNILDLSKCYGVPFKCVERINVNVGVCV
ncbi:TPA: hypothetical protein I7243_11625 [Vibrio vulnificus]|nr:hypothetical protein [Vibrio vulnificus]HDY7957624.1 acetyltransferase [Vibrio vulnificus]